MKKMVAATNIISSLLILVFAYTALSKLMAQTSFAKVLEQVPILSRGAAVIALLLPLGELFIVLLLLFERTRLVGLYASLVLLSLFTFYLVYMVLYVPHLPCSCGGVISMMSWREHIVFNLVLIGLTVVGIRNGRWWMMIDGG